jgi:hypothetical protein
MPFALRVCPFSIVVFCATAALVTYRKRNEKRLLASDRDADEQPGVKVVFVLGAPGVGKFACKELEYIDRLFS